jgi:hypothetical protein
VSQLVSRWNASYPNLSSLSVKKPGGPSGYRRDNSRSLDRRSPSSTAAERSVLPCRARRHDIIFSIRVIAEGHVRELSSSLARCRRASTIVVAETVVHRC